MRSPSLLQYRFVDLSETAHFGHCLRGRNSNPVATFSHTTVVFRMQPFNFYIARGFHDVHKYSRLMENHTDTNHRYTHSNLIISYRNLCCVAETHWTEARELFEIVFIMFT